MKNEKQVLVPRLRFPEFREEGAWDVCNLGDISTVVRGGSPRPIDGFITKDNSGLNWLKIGDVNKDAKYVTKTQEKVRAEALSKTREVHPGDLILSNSMSFGRPYLMKIKSCIHDGWIAITEIEESVEREYLYYLIFSSASQSYFLDNAAGSGVLNLNAEIIKSLPISYPAQTEQQKIADCLSSLDALITAQAEKIDALKIHKKGLMQQLFPREGETVPRLRFPEFRDSGEWKRLPLGEIVGFMSGGTPSKDRADYWGGDIPWVSAASMHEISIDRSDRNITQSAVDDGARIIPKGTLLILVRGSMLHKRIPIGITACKVAFNQDVKALRMKSDISEEFLLHLLISNEARLLCAVSGTGIGAGKLDTNELEGFLICVPDMKGEQQRIASCLSSLDALITAHSDKLGALKIHKKGLMQQLFPPAKKVEG
ncbi:MAG: restriction endonuclease subunit S [Natronospirillum sp.]